MAKGRGRSAARRRARTLASFVAAAGNLTLRQKKRIVEQALVLFTDNYVHLPLKRARYSVDPVQRLKLLLQTLDQESAEDPAWIPVAGRNEAGFHREVTDIFTSVRDLHMRYLLPAPFDEATAFLPFLIEVYWSGSGKDRQRKYIISHLAKHFRAGRFKPGVEVTHWNGTPIERAVWSNAQFFGGGNPEARHAHGLQQLTVRPLKTAPPPEENWVVVRYRAGRRERELKLQWRLAFSRSGDAGADARADAADRALDLEQHLTRSMHRRLYARIRPPRRDRASALPGGRGRDLRVQKDFRHAFSACPITIGSDVFGYLRVWSFQPPDGRKEEFIAEFIRLISKLPPGGLIIDVRGNGGGSVNCAERLLQTLTPHTIEPEPFQFINTPRNLAICRRDKVPSVSQSLKPWVDSMKRSLQTSAVHSAGIPIANPGKCNEIGQKYFGPVVLITDALSYSATDIFAAGFFDHEIGRVIGVDAYTGAGGANVWNHHDLVKSLRRGSADNVYKALPNGAGMRVSIRRALRVGRLAGTPLEDLGVSPDDRHFMTRQDVLYRNYDLIKRAAEELGERPHRAFKLSEAASPAGGTTLTAQVEGMNRLDVYVGERPAPPVRLSNGIATFTVPPGALVEIRGFQRNRLVARVRWPALP